ncbi:class I ribonucleotide reductase maintenance protein YfaE [Thalassotalea psychrophila]|uniref:Class I ribonucleotide reductase maintenance protein YfaE n=1 Tax=Thalassotalea psychrophila TaxID=3065647 RepID=A0ABY9TQ64_9GAMM|nr:class I ribonucleotide reductase maintenance protein YfaE [Colwelliaceae bacterium SQ149]
MTNKVTVDGKLVETDFDKLIFKTALEYLESNNIEIHYHCRDGFCGACRVTLDKGEIEYINGEPLAFVREGEILPCCCIPKTDITISTE